MTPNRLRITSKKIRHMKIITYLDSFTLEDYEQIQFDYEKEMVRFQMEGYKKEYYFQSLARAMEFTQEIIEALYSRRSEIDLSHIICVADRCSISSLCKEIEERINKSIHDEE